MTVKTGYFQGGDAMTLFINQGERDALVLGTIDELMIVEYEMPNGTTALQILKNEKSVSYGRSVSYASCPKKWLKAIRNGVGDWEGNCQRNGYVDFPKEGIEEVK